MSDAANIRMVEANLPGVDAEIQYAEGSPHRVRIRDGRPLAALRELSLDRSGFTQISHRSVLHDFSQEATIRDIYYRETEALLRDVTGAAEVRVFAHALREPLLRAQADFGPDAAQRLLRQHLPPDEAERRLAQRFAVVGLWRALATVERLPLALCDARSIGPDDFGPEEADGTRALRFGAAHRWYWFSRLRPDEALLFKSHDSAAGAATAQFSARAAFEDPGSSRETPPRRGIEAQALVFWGER